MSGEHAHEAKWSNMVDKMEIGAADALNEGYINLENLLERVDYSPDPFETVVIASATIELCGCGASRRVEDSANGSRVTEWGGS